MLVGCKNESKIEPVKAKHVSTMDTLAVFSYRRSYVDHHLLSEAELEKMYQSNPVFEGIDEFEKSDNLFGELEKLKIQEGNELIVERFEGIFSENIKFLDAQKRISFSYSSNFTQSNSIDIKIVKDGISTKKKIDFEADHFIGMILEDVDNDGIKEILILLNYYVMNGDNYILMITKFVP